MKTEPFYIRLAEHIKQKRTFDMRKDTGGYPTIHWLIARSLLENYPEYDRFELLRSYVGQVKNSLHVALDHLREQGILSYRSVPKATKKVLFITLDPSYDEAKRRDYSRQVNKTLINVRSFRRNINETHPDKAFVIRGETKQLEDKLGATL